MATGRAHLIAFSAGAQLLTLSAVMVPLLRGWGIIGAAFGDLASMAVLSLALWVACRLAMPHIEWNVARGAGAPVLAAGVAGVGGWAVGGQVSNLAIRFVVEAGVVAFGYVAILWWVGGRETMIRFSAILRDALGRLEQGSGVAEPGYRRIVK
jgi:hypothetical protein